MLYFLFSLVFASALIALYVWAYRALPQERWQFLAAIPVEKMPDGRWRGVNITFYGVFAASAAALSGAVFIGLAGAVGMPSAASVVYLFLLVLAGMAASRIFNYLLSGTRYGFTVAGSAFTGYLLAPLLFVALKRFTYLIPPHVHLMPIIAAAAIAYALGESVGRWGCVSFGCCYGKPVDEAPAWLQPLFRHMHFVFEGATKKAVYESGLDRTPLIPVQALSSFVLALLAAASLGTFLQSQYRIAFLISAVGAQLWRFLSEYLRQDERSNSRWRNYQILSLVAALVAVAWVQLDTTPVNDWSLPDPFAGWIALCQWPALLTLAIIWSAVLLRMGVSQVTTSYLVFSLRDDRV